MECEPTPPRARTPKQARPQNLATATLSILWTVCTILLSSSAYTNIAVTYPLPNHGFFVPEATTQKLVGHARSWYWLVSLAILCSLNAVASDLSNYPFSIDSEETPFGHRIVAVNAGPAPVTAKVSLVNSQYIKTSREFPLYVVVPPNGRTLFLGDIRRAMEKVGYTFRLKYEWVLGDMHAVQAPDARYRMPFRDGATYQITQAPGGPITTHTKPDSQFAIDIPMPEGTPLVAARAGTVIYTESGQVYGAKRPDMLGKANEVKILHSDGTIASYAHLAYGGVHVYPGQRVEEGQQIGLAGSTGYSSGPIFTSQFTPCVELAIRSR